MNHQPKSQMRKEVIEHTLRRHFLNLLAPFGWSVAMFLPLLTIALGLNALQLTAEPLFRAGVWMFGGLYVVFVVSFFMMQWIFWYLDAWIITKERLIDIQLITLFNRRVSQILFSQVQDVRFSVQGTLASIFGFGDIKVQSAGKESFFELRSIPNARKWVQRINEYSEASHSSPEPTDVIQVKPSPTQTLGEILIAKGIISHQELTMALKEQHTSGRRLGKILLDKNLISREELIQALGNQYHMPSIDLSRYEIDPEVVKQMSYETALKYIVVPIARSAEALTIAIAEPSPDKIGELAAQFDTPLAFMVADEDYIREVITGYYMSEQKEDHRGTGAGGGSDVQKATLEELGVE